MGGFVINTILELKDITKIFPGVIALNQVSFSVTQGTVHGIVGENGAGKSTMMNIISGILKADAGELFIEGERVEFSSRHDALNKGVGIVFQELSLIPTLSIAENIFANRLPLTKGGLINWKRLWAEAKNVLEAFNVNLSPRMLISQISAANQQLVEIITAVSSNPKILILDEPTSSLTKVETEILFANIRRLKEEGCTIIYISHHLKEVFNVCDNISIFKDGQHVCDAVVPEIDEAFIVKNMVGREISNMYGVRDPMELEEITEREPVLQVECAARRGKYYDVSFEIRPGEIVGLAGLVGAGRSEVCRGIAGIEPFDSGEIIFEGSRVQVNSVQGAIRKGIGYMTEDRKYDGLFLSDTIAFNILANKLDSFTKYGIVNDKKAEPVVHEAIEKYGIVCTGPDQEVGTLSGGNQQKVLFAEWIGISPKVLIADEPTRGIDVGARSEIYRLIRELAAKGTAIIIVSSDLPEVLQMSDRVIVMRNGTVVGEVAAEELSEETVMNLVSGVISKKRTAVN